MENFIFQNPTKLVFGKGMIAKLSRLIPADRRVMVTFGGGSVRRNGVYDEVCKALAGRDTVEFWDIEPNPSIETLRKAIDLGKEKRVDFLLAVGGGSVIDGTKLISAGLLYDGDAWDLVLKGSETHAVPFGTVLTIPATGSEMNNGAVISRHETKEKYPFYSNYPRFSVLDPEKTFTLPERQVACGIASTESPVALIIKGYSPSGRRVPSAGSSCVQAVAERSSTAAPESIYDRCLKLMIPQVLNVLSISLHSHCRRLPDSSR